jgi:uncharacterized protein (TIRG00374 family)
MANKQRSINDTLSKITAVVVGALLIVHLFKDVEFEKVFSLIGKIGAPIALVLLPYLFIGIFDSLAWKITIESVTQKVPYLRLLYIRLCTEAMLMSLPGGAAIAEAAKPYLLKRNVGMSTTEAIAIVAVKKGLLGVAHGFYLAVSASLGFSALKLVSEQMIGFRGLEWFAWLAAAFIFVIFGGATLLFLYGGISQRIHQLLMAIPVARLRDWLLEKEKHFIETDAHFEQFHNIKRRKLSLAVFMFFIGWMFETIDSLLILRLLEVDLPFGALMCMETTMSLIRALLFILPAGLGVQDYGYVLFLKSFGVPDAESVGVAFVLMKRSKELIWIVIGYIFMAMGGVKASELAESEKATG